MIDEMHGKEYAPRRHSRPSIHFNGNSEQSIGRARNIEE